MRGQADEIGGPRLLRWVRGLLGIVPLPGAGRWALASLIDAVGSGAFIPLTVLYFTLHVGLSASSVGVGLTIGGLTAMLVAPLAGALIDGFGAKPMLLSCWALAAFAYAAYGVVRTWPEFVAAVVAAEIASSTSSTARSKLVTDLVTGEARVTMLASQRSLRNVGFGVGGLLATAALAIGGGAYLVVVLGNAASYLLALGLVAGMRVPRIRHPHGGRGAAAGLRTVLADRRYLGFTALEFLAGFHDSALQVALPLWVALHTHAPKALAGMLFTLNTVIVVLAQVRTARRVAGLGDVPRAARRTAATMAACAAAYLAAHYVGEAAAIALLIVGAVLHTGVEMLASAGSWTISVALADEERRGAYLSVFSLGDRLQDAIGPTIITSVLLLGSVWLWPVLFALVCAGSLGNAVAVTAVQRRVPVPA